MFEYPILNVEIDLIDNKVPRLCIHDAGAWLLKKRYFQEIRSKVSIDVSETIRVKTYALMK